VVRAGELTGHAATRRDDERHEVRIAAVTLIPGDEQDAAFAPGSRRGDAIDDAVEPGARLIDRTVMAVVAEAGRDPDELRGRAREVGIERLEGNDVRRACAAVIGERVVLE